jgi:hypothetical protein
MEGGVAISSKQKQTTTQAQTGNSAYNNTNTYGWMDTPDSADIKAYRDWTPQMDQSISYGAGNAKNQLEKSFNNPLGGYTTPAMRDAALRSGNRQIDQDASQAFRVGQQDVNQQRGGQLGTLAGMTAPRLVQTGGSGTGSSSGSGNSTTTTSSSPWDSIISGGLSAATM